MIETVSKNKIRIIAFSVLLFAAAALLGVDMTVPPLLLAVVACLMFFRKKCGLDNCNLLYLSLLFTLIFSWSFFVINNGLCIFYIPFALIPMLATLLFSSLELSFLLTVAVSFSVAALYGGKLDIAVLFLVSGIFSSILVKETRRRMDVIRAGVAAGIIQSVLFVLMEGLKLNGSCGIAALFINGLISGVIAIGILPVFEYLFKTVTNISLLELADFNQPLLRRMILEAPGTYHHSLVVGNLAEAACGAIDANALLARIGAYYHDIGKLSKPEYFSENQIPSFNKHDDLSPSMSKLVIMNHVKEGSELAEKYKLNPKLADFIRQHHGTSLVYYFYRRALEKFDASKPVDEEGFRYPGPKPNSKETAVVMLADSVEAASRTIKEPTPANIEDLVYKIINNKFIDGQLDSCDLTLKDLEKISAEFIRILSGMYHSRINYPENNGK